MSNINNLPSKKTYLPTLLITWIINFIFLWKFSEVVSQYPIGKNSSLISYLGSSLGVLSILLYVVGFLVLLATLLITNKSINKYYDYFLNAPIIIPFINVIALLLGIYASVTSAEILTWLTNVSDTPSMSYTGFNYFLFSLFILLLGYGLTGSANKRAKEFNNSLQKQRLNELEEVIRLAPPGAFSEQLSHYCDIMEDWSSNHIMMQTNKFAFIEDNSLNDLVINEIEDVLEEQRTYIRACLTAFARLAGTYDNASMNLSSPDTYRANIMLKTTKNIAHHLASGTESEAFKSRYFPKINAIPDHRLYLDKRYSIKINNSDKAILENELAENDFHIPVKFDPDSEIKNLILPVFENDPNIDAYGYDQYEEFDYKTYNLIGAPHALVTGHPQFIYDAEEQTEEWLGTGAPKALYEAARQYFQNDKKGQSIISFPLLSNRYGNGSLKTDNISGALNIYRNTKNMFSKDDDKFNNFFHLTSPALVSLSRIVEFHLILLNKVTNYNIMKPENIKEDEDVRTTKTAS
jgi:hypothetical protein